MNILVAKITQLKDNVYTEWKQNWNDDNDKPYIVGYAPLVVMLFFTFKKLGKWPTF